MPRAIVTEPAELDPIIRFYREERLVTNPIRAAVLDEVREVEPVTSPSYVPFSSRLHCIASDTAVSAPARGETTRLSPSTPRQRPR